MSTPAPSQPPEEPPKLRFLDIVVLALSIYVLAAMLVEASLPLSLEMRRLIDGIDVFVCLVFLTEFCLRFHRAPSKLRFMRWGWIDLLASIPVVDSLRWGRLVRLMRIIRILRGFRSARHIVEFLYRNRSGNLAGTTILTAVILVIFSSIAVLAFETHEGSNIRTPLDAIWWAMTTMTTVGYGDRFPVTLEGKIVAMVLMVVGVGLFGVLTGLFARLFVEPELKKEGADINLVLEELRELRGEVASLRSELKLVRPD